MAIKKENQTNENIIRKTIKVGNSAGVLLPKKFLGSEVKVSIIKKPLNIKKEVFKSLEDIFEEILGVFLLNKKPAEVLAVSSKTKKIIKEEIKISVVPLSTIKKDIKTKDEARARLIRAKPIMNKNLLKKLKEDIRKIKKEV